jgi:hypothetical protein
MSGFFKFVLYLGVVAGLLGFAWSYLGLANNPSLASLPPETPRYLSFGGLGLIIVGLVGRSATKEEKHEWK